MLNFLKGAEFGECKNRPSWKPYKIRVFENSSSLVQTAKLQKPLRNERLFLWGKLGSIRIRMDQDHFGDQDHFLGFCFFKQIIFRV